VPLVAGDAIPRARFRLEEGRKVEAGGATS
jgi:hypothetical protein